MGFAYSVEVGVKPRLFIFPLVVVEFMPVVCVRFFKEPPILRTAFEETIRKDKVFGAVIAKMPSYQS